MKNELANRDYLDKFFENVNKEYQDIKEYPSLSDFILGVWEDLETYISKGQVLCFLRNMYDSGNNPNYKNIHVQQLYLLRYVLAYAFENREMYLWVLKNHCKSELSVESLGCGSAVDAWSLASAARSLDIDYTRFSYTGVDIVLWRYLFNTIKGEIIKMNAADYVESKKTLDSDVYIFPRSIGDFSNQDFERICNAFANKKIQKECIYILISHRKGQKTISREDARRTGEICRAIKQHNLTFTDVCTENVKKTSSGL